MIAATFLDFSLYPLAWVAFAPLVFALRSASSARAAVTIGLVAGFATNVPAFHWLVYTIHTFGGFPYPIAAFFYLCLSLWGAAQLVLFALAVRLLGPGPLALAPALVWTTLEFLYPNLFPWRMANTQLHAPLLTQIGDVTGPFALSLVMVWLSSALAFCVGSGRRHAKSVAAAVVAVLAVALYGLWRMPAIEAEIAAVPPVRVGLVQGNVGIREKGNAAYFEVNVDKYRQLTDALPDDVDLIVWPESVLQSWVHVDVTYLPPKERPHPGARRPMIYGGLAFAPRGAEQYDKYNSAFLLTPAGDVLARYDKQILLPFGEYLPGSSLFPWVHDISPQSGDFTAGQRSVIMDVPGRARVAPLICYEDVPAGIARRMAAEGAEVLLNMFNDAWFGDSMAPYQHEALALWRAIENRRYFVRAGNAGATGVIDPFGRIVEHTDLFVEGTVVADVHPLRLQTFYTRYGDVFGWVVTVVTLMWLVVRGLGVGRRPQAAGRG